MTADPSFNLVNKSVSYSINVSNVGTIIVGAYIYRPSSNSYLFSPLFANEIQLTLSPYVELVADFENDKLYFDDVEIPIRDSLGYPVSLKNVTSLAVLT